MTYQQMYKKYYNLAAKPYRKYKLKKSVKGVQKAFHMNKQVKDSTLPTKPVKQLPKQSQLFVAARPVWTQYFIDVAALAFVLTAVLYLIHK